MYVKKDWSQGPRYNKVPLYPKVHIFGLGLE